jgi:uncharacterized membrane protein YbhN (UPF0104 family)
MIGGLIGVVGHRGELREVWRLFRQIKPIWLVAGLALQTVTYACAAGVWSVALRRSGHTQSLRSLMSLALAMLCSNQLVPSAGLSGGLVVVRALVRKAVPESIAMGALLVGLVTTYAGFLAALGIAMPWALAHRPAGTIGTIAGSAFLLMAASVTYVAFAAKRLPPRWHRRLSRLPLAGDAIAAIADVPTGVMAPAVLAQATLLHALEITMDAATLGVSLFAVGAPLSPAAVLAAYVIASIASRVAFVPLGIGTFEAASVVVLHGASVPLEPALAATLVFRGFTLWLPMLPGLWFARQALQADSVPGLRR